MLFVPVSLALLVSLSGANAQACTWSDAATTYSTLGGSPATFELTVVGEALTNADRITWTLGSTTLVQLRYSATAPTFEELINTTGVTAVWDNGKHTLTISSLGTAYNGQQLTVTSGGCGSNDVSNPITFDLKYGDLYQPEGYAIDQSACGYNCERDFQCTNYDHLTFKGKLQADLTWAVEYDSRNAGAYALMGIGIAFTLAHVAILYQRCVVTMRINDELPEKYKIKVTPAMTLFHGVCIISSFLLAIVNIILVAIPQGPYCPAVRIVGGIAVASLSVIFDGICIGIHVVNWPPVPDTKSDTKAVDTPDSSGNKVNDYKTHEEKNDRS